MYIITTIIIVINAGDRVEILGMDGLVMKLSTRSRYGLSFMLELAKHYGEGPIFLRDIARKHKLSLKYLGNLILPLKTAGLINSVRGAHGGYLLAKKPAEISLLDLVEALEGSLSLVDCVGDPGICKKADHCVNRAVWADLSRAVVDKLRGQSLSGVLEMQKSMHQKQPFYQI